MKDYFSRAARYILKMIVLIGILFAIMALTGTLRVQNDEIIKALFLSRNGIILICVLVILALLYPKLAFSRESIRVDFENDKEAIVNAMTSLGFKPVESDSRRMIFRAATPMKRFSYLWDDKITITPERKYIEAEGLKKVVSRLGARINAQL